MSKREIFGRLALALFLASGTWAFLDVNLGLTESGRLSGEALGIRRLPGLAEYAFLGVSSLFAAAGAAWAAWPLVRRLTGRKEGRPRDARAAELLARLESEADQAKERMRDDADFRRIALWALTDRNLRRGEPVHDYAAVTTAADAAGAASGVPEGELLGVLRRLKGHLARLRRELEHAAREAEGRVGRDV